MRTRLRLTSTVWLAITTAAAAQPAPRYTVERLADDVHAVIYNRPIDVEGNTLVVINQDHVVVVDANAGLTTARATIAEIRKLTSKPVRYVINTHWHDDHVYGNQAYADAYPGVQFIAHPLTRQDIVNHAFASNPFVIDLIDADVKRLQGYLDTGVYRDGKPVAGELETRIRNYLANRGEAFADRKAFRPVVPTIDVADALTLESGSRQIQVRYLGRGNTRGDLVVYLPAERILATGDLVVAPVPYATNVYPTEWVKTLDALMAIPAQTVLPGHGPVMRDWSYVRRVKDAIAKHLAAVRDAKAQQLSLAKTQEVVQLSDVREGFVAADEGLRAGYEAFFRPTLVRNAWEELDPAIMHAYDAAPGTAFADDVYTIGEAGRGLTAILNTKDVVLVTSLTATASAHAAVRRLRELTSKPVTHIVVSGNADVQKAALDALREAYQQSELVMAPRTITANGRELLIEGNPGSLVVTVPAERIRIERGGSAVRTK